MARGRRTHEHVQTGVDLVEAFVSIRDDVGKAFTRTELFDLHERAGSLVDLTGDSSWLERSGDEGNLHNLARDEFTLTARKINERARDIGADSDYSEEWNRAR
ncbi:MAG: hypothetical protein FJ320_09965 [SAR202 cluster bacterium]|nr:hypothetical protein [SAR202 cluster bacterium]